jgi:hypothetical protein
VLEDLIAVELVHASRLANDLPGGARVEADKLEGGSMGLGRRRSLVLLLTLGAALLAIGAVSSSAAGEATYSARIFVSEKFPAFHGAIHSKSAFCVAKRPLLVFRVRPGDDKRLGHRRSNGDGTWKVPLGKKLSSGDYYVEAPRYGSASLGITCLRARSKIVPVH